MLVCAGSSNLPLARSLATYLHAKLLDRELSTFPNGERRVHVLNGDAIKGQTILVVQSFSAPADEHIIEMALLVDTIKRAGAKRIYALIPWLGYSLQNDVFRPGEPNAAQVVADMVSTLPLTKIFLVDLHDPKIAKFFSVPTRHIETLSSFAEEIKKHAGKDAVIVAPDKGGKPRAAVLAKKIGAPLVELSKSRHRDTGEVAMVGGDGVEGKTAITIDDMINTGTTMLHVAEILHAKGAKKILAYASHALCNADHVKNLAKSSIDQIVVGDTINNPAVSASKEFRVISFAQLIAKQIKADLA
ncbi:MAG TPA: ribose-phosphate pyrophosphokinase [Candidatus Saccharimonadia bacterium]|nr:ribose-phosphate pyrophosphokinase [Candidatus Saccharimonadia bacterium]